ncbi:hypothetical protein SAMN04487965_1449 [Microbulbifer donghaiensis]|uniref:Lipoprotein n=1 Tax=Microbulbifer donghaiensis TaxID=494016 RepID=A0A1M4Z674_9GAMM|nr:hypothetical protein [Microbulbifer donghaiensis]SHF13521.1 hypothetical protein SAMN04487965_1449 [Microbulbifer donghaiensis]
MNRERKMILTGASLALAAASLITSGASLANQKQASSGDTTDLVHCYGVNVCKGHNDCKTANNDCGGKSSCKGSSFVAMPSKACADVGGKVSDDWKGSVKTADLAHCYGVNVCKGHNDCNTAKHDCAGKASCKGSGWVAMPAKACTDIGGKVKS